MPKVVNWQQQATVATAFTKIRSNNSAAAKKKKIKIKIRNISECPAVF